MRVLGIAFLAVIAFLAGGCSILSLAYFGSDSFILSIPGLIIAGLSFLGIRALWRKS